MTKRFTVYGVANQEFNAHIEVTNNVGGMGRLFLDGQLVLNGVYNITNDGFNISVPADSMDPGKYALTIELSDDGNEWVKVAEGILHSKTVANNGGASNVWVDNMPEVYPMPSGQFDSIVTELSSINANTSGGGSTGLTDAELRAAPVDVDTGLTVQTDALTDFELRAAPLDALLLNAVKQTLVVSTAGSVTLTGPVNDSVVADIPPGSRIRLIRNAGHVDPQASETAFPLVTVKIGDTVIYRDKLEAGLPWSETVCFEGADGEDLTISIDSAVTVYLNMRYEVF